jgi:DNA-binding CsgD family transcriptional regulator
MSRSTWRPSVNDELIAGIYDASVGAKDWAEVLDDLRKVFGACAAVFAVKEIGSGSGVQVGVDPEIMRLFYERHAGRNPLALRAASAPVGAVLTDQSGMPKAEFVRTDFYGECLHPQGMHALMNLRASRGTSSVADICLARDRRRGEFETADIHLFKRLAPHLQRAVVVGMRLAEADAERSALAGALDQLPWAALVVEGAGAVRFANAAASVLLTAGDGLRTNSGGAGLIAALDSETADLRRMIAAALPIGGGAAGGMRLSRPAPRAPLIVTAVPLRAKASVSVGLAPVPAVLLLVADPEAAMPSASRTLLRSVFGLTDAETAVALHIARGEDLPTVAAALDVSLATVRTHLHRSFDKTGVHRQAELASLLARLGPAEEPTSRQARGVSPATAAGSARPCGRI